MSPKPENKMGKWGAISYIIGNIIGSGIFITPSTILNNVNSVGASLAVWVLSAFIAVLGAFCYVELGTSIRRSGCDYAYLCYAKWKPLAFVFMMCAVLFSGPAMLAIQLESFSVYLTQGMGIEFCDERTKFVAYKLIGFCLLLLLLLINSFSVRRIVARFQMAALFAKIFSTGIIILIGMYLLIFRAKTQNLVDPFANSTLGPAKVTNAFFAGLFSYEGWDVLNYGIEDVADPRRVMPFAIVVGLGTVVLIYTAINLSYFAVLNVSEFQQSNAIAMTFAAKTMGPVQAVMPFLVCLVLVGAINGSIFCSSRYLFAAARERQFPSFISCINPKHDSPRAALFVTVSLAIAISFLGNLEQLISYVGFTYWLQRSFAILVLLYIRLWKRPVHEYAIKVPLPMPIVFLMICASLVIVTLTKDFWTSFVGLMFLFAGFVVYMVFMREWAWNFQRFAWYRNCARVINERLNMLSQIVFDGVIEVVETKEDYSGKKRSSKVGDAGMEFRRIRPTVAK